RAAILGQGDDSEPRSSFHALFVSLMVASEPELAWIGEAAAELGVKLDVVLEHWSRTFTPTSDAITRARQLTQPIRFARTSSAQAIVDAADRLALAAGEHNTDVEHLLAALILEPAGHE